jgi:hypothetical protein
LLTSRIGAPCCILTNYRNFQRMIRNRKVILNGLLGRRFGRVATRPGAVRRKRRAIGHGRSAEAERREILFA